MKSENLYVNDNTFLVFLHNTFPNFNFANNDYIQIIKDEYFMIADNNLPLYKGSSILRKILINHGYDKVRSHTVSHWNSLGYTDRNEIRSQIYREYQKSKRFKYFIFDNDDKKFKEFLNDNLTVFNYDNVEYYNYIKSEIFKDALFINPVPARNDLLSIIYKDNKRPSSYVSVVYWTARGYSEEYAKTEISKIQKTRSKRCKEYYTSRGYDEETAKTLVTDEQKKFCNCSKGTSAYWRNIGFSDDDAKKMAAEYTSKSSIWAESFWIKKGYTPEEAKKKLLEYNPSSPQYYKYMNDYGLYIKKIKRSSEQAISRWRSKEYQNKILCSVKEGKISTKSVSKEETAAFEFLQKHVDNRIKHEAYPISIPEDSSTSVNTYFYFCDGYLNDNGHIIIFEYDGLIFHNDKRDEIRDYDILSIDNRIIGIIRITNKFYLNRDITIEEKIKNIKDAIQTIKNSTEVRIKL